VRVAVIDPPLKPGVRAVGEVAAQVNQLGRFRHELTFLHPLEAGALQNVWVHVRHVSCEQGEGVSVGFQISLSGWPEA
jgi:hypothetical protein